MGRFKAIAHFFFSPRSTTPLGILRILVGGLIFFWAITLWLQKEMWFGSPGLISPETADRWIITFCRECVDPSVLWPGPRGGFFYAVCLSLLMFTSIGFAVGAFTYFSGWMTFVLLQICMIRGIFAMYGGDFLLKTLLFYLLLSPCGRVLSWDCRRTPSYRLTSAAPWALRLIQIQIALVYVATVLYKGMTPNWQYGNAVYYSTQLRHYNRAPLPLEALTSTEGNLVTWIILAVELALGTLIWWRPLRPWVVLAGLALHFGMDYSMSIPFWQVTMMIGLLSFIDGPTLKRLHGQLRQFGKILVKKSILREFPATGIS